MSRQAASLAFVTFLSLFGGNHEIVQPDELWIAGRRVCRHARHHRRSVRAGPGRQRTERRAPPKDAKDSARSKALQDLELAYELIRYGRQEKSPESLLMAAQILHKTPTDPLGVESKTEGASKGTATPAKMDNSPKALLAEAKKMASGSQLDGMAMATEKMLEESTRGATSGPRVDSFTIGAFQVVNWNPINFQANQKAEVYIHVGVNSRMVLEVTDEFGNVVARDNVPGSYYRCVWYPNWTGPFRIRLTSSDSIPLRCGMATN